MIPETPTPMDENTGTCAGSPPARGSDSTSAEAIIRRAITMQETIEQGLDNEISREAIRLLTGATIVTLLQAIRELRSPNDPSSGTA